MSTELASAAAPAEHADALDWLARQQPGSARAVVFDPPYSRNKPPRGKWDGMGGSVYGPFEFMHRAMLASSRALMHGGILIGFCDWELLTDLGYIASVSGLRNRTHFVWCASEKAGGTGGIFRGSASPVLIASHVSPDTVDDSNVPNWILAPRVQGKARVHPYQKPALVYETILRRVCRRGDTILDPFAGSGSSRVACENLGLGLQWKGADIDPAYAISTSSRPRPRPGGPPERVSEEGHADRY